MQNWIRIKTFGVYICSLIYKFFKIGKVYLGNFGEPLFFKLNLKKTIIFWVCYKNMYSIENTNF
jgi:TM2 domain-containing membrane protein YozV